jgi:hypothetical protein
VAADLCSVQGQRLGPIVRCSGLVHRRGRDDLPSSDETAVQVGEQRLATVGDQLIHSCAGTRCDRRPGMANGAGRQYMGGRDPSATARWHGAGLQRNCAASEPGRWRYPHLLPVAMRFAARIGSPGSQSRALLATLIPGSASSAAAIRCASVAAVSDPGRSSGRAPAADLLR